MVSGTQEIRAALMPVFEKYAGKVSFAYLFGSTAKGEIRPSSDVDIAVFFRHESAVFLFDLRLSLHADACRALKRSDVDVLALNTTRNIVILDEIVRNGLLLFEDDPEARTEFEVSVLHDAIDFKTQRYAVIGV
jgi:predicted nucleotidyltransferase